MIGIIYKFIIKAKYQKDGHKPFYIGQHWCRSVSDFLCRDYPYYGSGKIWNSFLNRLKKDYPDKWRYFIKREVLCTVTNNSQKTLDRLEEFWIKRERAHYSFGIGGCNVLWGATTNISHIDPIVKRKISDKWKDVDFRNMMVQIHIGLQAGEKHPLYGKKHSSASIKKMSDSHKKFYQRKGKYHLSESHKQKISKSHIGAKNPMWGKKISEETKLKISRHYKGGIVVTNGTITKYLRKGEEIPEGFVRGRRKSNA